MINEITSLARAEKSIVTERKSTSLLISLLSWFRPFLFVMPPPRKILFSGLPPLVENLIPKMLTILLKIWVPTPTNLMVAGFGNILPSIKFFLRKCWLNCLPVSMNLARRGLNIGTSCHFCSSFEESILHFIRDCTVARNFWLKSGLPGSLPNFFSADLHC